MYLKRGKIKIVNKKIYCTRRNILFTLISNKHIFKLCPKRSLCNVFVDDRQALAAAANIQDLLCIYQKGKERILSYIRQYILVSPKELKQKRRRQKLSTFTKIKDSARKMTTELNQATLLLSSAYKSLLNPKKGYKQTLALCNPSGQMRTCNKSSFKDVIQNIFQTENIFLSQHDIFIVCKILMGKNHELMAMVKCINAKEKQS